MKIFKKMTVAVIIVVATSINICWADNCIDSSRCPGVPWNVLFDTMILNDFPNCRIVYRYRYRQCGDEFQMESMNIGYVFADMYTGGPCSGIFEYMLSPNYNGYDPKKWQI